MLKISSSSIDALICASDHGLSHPVESFGAVTIGLAGNKISLVKCLLIYRWRIISFFHGAKTRSGPGRAGPGWARIFSLLRLHDHIQTHHTW